MNSWKGITSLTYSQIKDLQNQRLHSFINTHVYPFSPYYRKLFDDKKIDPRHIRTKEDLKRIPYISKSDLIGKDNPQKFKDFILQPDKEKISRYWPKITLVDTCGQVLASRPAAWRMIWAENTVRCL